MASLLEHREGAVSTCALENNHLASVLFLFLLEVAGTVDHVPAHRIDVQSPQEPGSSRILAYLQQIPMEIYLNGLEIEDGL